MEQQDHLIFKQPEQLKIPVLEERLQVSKRWEETGKLRVVKSVIQEEASYAVSLAAEKVTMETIPINQLIEAAPPAVRQEGNVTIISVVKEVLVTEKKLMLVEEVHITRHAAETLITGSAAVRREKVTITRTDPNRPATS